MKLIVALCLIGSALATARGNPPGTKLCLGRADADNTNCTACLNSPTGIGAQFKSTNDCAPITAPTVDCLIYNPTKANDTLTAGDCLQCNSKNWYVARSGQGVQGTASECTDTDPGAPCANHTSITNCDQRLCFIDANGSNAGCAVCAANWKPNTTAVGATMGAAACIAASTGGAIADCTVYHPVTNTKCRICAANKSVNAAETDCVDWTADTNCRMLGTGNDWCQFCNDGYYFSGQKCTNGMTSSTTAAGTPLATSLCMGRIDNTALCSSCYNYGTGPTEAKVLSATTNLCATTRTAITDCLWYATTAKTNNTADKLDCGQCNAKDWLNVVVDAQAAVTSIACSATALANEAACDAKVADCDQTYCYKAGTNNALKGCRLCAAGKKPSGANASGLGLSTCVATTQGDVADCSVFDPTNASNCFVCTAGHAVDWKVDTACRDFTADANCRKAGDDFEAYCGECKNGYYFNNGTCTIGYQDATTTAMAKLMSFAALSMALLSFLN